MIPLQIFRPEASKIEHMLPDHAIGMLIFILVEAGLGKRRKNGLMVETMPLPPALTVKVAVELVSLQLPVFITHLKIWLLLFAIDTLLMRSVLLVAPEN